MSPVFIRWLGGWFWPVSKRVDTTAAVRGGRVVHWMFAALAAMIEMVAVIVGLGDGSLSAFMGISAAAVFVALFGRGIRYIAGNE